MSGTSTRVDDQRMKGRFGHHVQVADTNAQRDVVVADCWSAVKDRFEIVDLEPLVPRLMLRIDNDSNTGPPANCDPPSIGVDGRGDHFCDAD